MSKLISFKDFIVAGETGDDLVDFNSQKLKLGVVGEGAVKEAAQFPTKQAAHDYAVKALTDRPPKDPDDGIEIHHIADGSHAGYHVNSRANFRGAEWLRNNKSKKLHTVYKDHRGLRVESAEMNEKKQPDLKKDAEVRKAESGGPQIDKKPYTHDTSVSWPGPGFAGRKAPDYGKIRKKINENRVSRGISIMEASEADKTSEWAIKTNTYAAHATARIHHLAAAQSCHDSAAAYGKDSQARAKYLLQAKHHSKMSRKHIRLGDKCTQNR